MHALAVLSAGVAAFFVSSASASPVPRQDVQMGYITNDALGTAWTLMDDLDASGVPIGLSPLQSPPALGQIWFMEEFSNGTTGPFVYGFSSYVEPVWASLVQTTSSEDYAPGYDMLQSNTARPTFFTRTPGYDVGSYYLSPNLALLDPQPQYQLNWYHYDDPTAEFIPLIMDATLAGSDQSFTWHPYSP